MSNYLLETSFYSSETPLFLLHTSKLLPAVTEAAAPAKGGVAASPHDPLPTAVLPERPQQGSPQVPWLPTAQWPPFLL